MTTIGLAAREIQEKLGNDLPILSFVANDDLIHCVDEFYAVILEQLAQDDVNQHAWSDWEFWKNGVDPFATVASAIVSNRDSIEAHLREVEEVRQRDKTISNAVGYFHQHLMGRLDGCSDPGVGGEIDLIVNRTDCRIIAEIKNKWNTTKGDDRVQPYDKLERLLNAGYQGYIGYYVNIIPKPVQRRGYTPLNRPFTPSQNGQRRPSRGDIREVDGKSFYTLLTGAENALPDLYAQFPKLLAYCINRRDTSRGDEPLIGSSDAHFGYLFAHIYANNPGQPPR